MMVLMKVIDTLQPGEDFVFNHTSWAKRSHARGLVESRLCLIVLKNKPFFRLCITVDNLHI